MSGFFSVITTIQTPTKSVYKLLEKLEEHSGDLVVAGDEKGPQEYNPKSNGKVVCNGNRSRIHFLSLQNQLESKFELARKLPTSHYSRKNIGYLYAIEQGATLIYETDDDNEPMQCWRPRDEYIDDVRVASSKTEEKGEASRWVNIYKYFTNEKIWPRGLPLDEIRKPPPGIIDHESGSKKQRSPIQQGLVNDSPDVDAIWRLVLDRRFQFDNRISVFLPSGYWCPFNTQSTWWWPIAYPLLYVPSHCSFRVCDIWKSFVAQRCIWELDAGVTFHAPEVVQDRNIHDIMNDFKDEIPGYARNRKLVDVLENINLEAGDEKVAENLRSCYDALVGAKFFPVEELKLLDAWLLDLSKNQQSLQ
jgi:STELLO glycosyltransferase-like protein